MIFFNILRIFEKSSSVNEELTPKTIVTIPDGLLDHPFVLLLELSTKVFNVKNPFTKLVDFTSERKVIYLLSLIEDQT